jgi:hypothetical protein
MPPDEQKYSNKIKPEKNVLRFRKGKKIKNFSKNLHAMCD